MRRILLALLLLPLQTLAQVPMPPCQPAQAGGTGTPYGEWRSEYAPGQFGLVRSYYCPTQFGWTPHYVVCKPATLKGECPSVAGMSLALTPMQAWAKTISSDANGAEWKPIMDRARLSIDADKPPPPAYIVAKSGAALTRPVYAFTPGASAPSTGTRGTKKIGDAAVGSPCDCSKRVVGTTIYCGAASGVAACARKP